VELSKLEIINYQPSKRAYQIQFRFPRPDISKLNLSKNTLLNHQNNIEKAISLCYLVKNHKICRNKIILEYFNEKSSEKCGNCDNCLNYIKKESSPKKIVKNAIEILLKYENKSPKDIYLELSEVMEKEDFKSIIKTLLKEELLTLDNNNLISLNY
jgi:ATP-dependent DNA helicase RecQ